MNSHTMLEELRSNVAEPDPNFWADAELLRKLNAKQLKVATMLSMSRGNWLTKSKNITPVASKVAFPSDCAKVIYLEETSTGYPIAININVSERRISRGYANSFISSIYSGRDAYLVNDGIMINVDDYTTQVTLWYQRRVPNLHVGKAQTGSGAAVVILGSTDGEDQSGHGAEIVDDYYNDVKIERISGTQISDTITDYTGSTRSAVVTGTFAAGDIYGTVPVIPEECHNLIVIEATVAALGKPGSTASEHTVNYYINELREARAMFKRWCSSRVIGGHHGTI